MIKTKVKSILITGFRAFMITCAVVALIGVAAPGFVGVFTSIASSIVLGLGILTSVGMSIKA